MEEGLALEEALALIEQIILEHKVIMEGVQTLEQVANDTGAITGLEKAKEAFMPGRFDEKESLQKLQEQMGTIAGELQAHFDSEETRLLAAFEKYGDRRLVSALHSLLVEHEDIRNRFTDSRAQVSELINGNLSRHIWEASAHDMRAHITHTRRLLGTHAGFEHELLMTLQKELRQEQKGE